MGVIFGSKLQWTDHIAHALNQSMKALNAIRLYFSCQTHTTRTHTHTSYPKHKSPPGPSTPPQHHPPPTTHQHQCQHHHHISPGYIKIRQILFHRIKHLILGSQLDLTRCFPIPGQNIQHKANHQHMFSWTSF